MQNKYNIVLFQSIMNTYNGKLFGYELWILRRNEVWKYVR